MLPACHLRCASCIIAKSQALVSMRDLSLSFQSEQLTNVIAFASLANRVYGSPALCQDDLSARIYAS